MLLYSVISQINSILISENTEADPHLMAIGETNKRKVLNELEESYKRRGMTEYAPRLGELLAITTFFQVSIAFLKN